MTMANDQQADDVEDVDVLEEATDYKPTEDG